VIGGKGDCWDDCNVISTKYTNFIIQVSTTAIVHIYMGDKYLFPNSSCSFADIQGFFADIYGPFADISASLPRFRCLGFPGRMVASIPSSLRPHILVS